jgi:branched-chain amino acid transport system permease protein
MSMTLFLILCLNGLQYGMLLFLIAAGLTLVFGVMGFINLAHGVQYMVGAYLVFAYVQLTGSFVWAALLSVSTALVFGAKVVFGPTTLSIAPPEFLSGSIQLTETLRYPVYRFFTIVAGLAVALALFFTVSYTRIGMLIRAGATTPEMVSALGVNIQQLFMIVFGVGAMLAGFAGIIAAPIFAIEPGMGDNILIVVFVVIIIGGIGSIGGAFVASLLVGLIDTLGRSFATIILSEVFSPSFANQIGPALASMLIYILMAAILVFRPKGLLPAKGVA